MHTMPIAGEKFHKLYQEAKDADVQTDYFVDEMIAVLFDEGLARMRFVPPKQVGIHKSNRDAVGVLDEGNVHDMGMEIHADGFIWTAAEEAIAFEDDDEGTNATFTCAVCNDNKSLANDHFRL